MEPVFLSEKDILAIHRRSLADWGGQKGLRDRGGLSSAVNAPRNVFHYRNETDLFELASTYAFHIAEAQAFFDGNKRAGLGAALVFLDLNGVELPESANDALYEGLLKSASKEMGKSDFASLLRGLAK